MTDRITTAATAEVLATQLDVYRQDIESAYARLDRLIVGLETGDQHAVDHAEERIDFVLDSLKGSVRSLEYIKRYTVTGARRQTTA